MQNKYGAVIKLDNITIIKGKVRLLHAVSLDIKPGTSTALLGPSGCGKTTLLRVIAGLENVSGGRVTIDGKCPQDMYPNRSITLLFQEPRLWKHLTVRKNLELIFLINGKEPDEAKIAMILSKLGLEEFVEFYPGELSVGMRARLAIARAFCVPARLLLADEPFAALDPPRRLNLNQQFRDLCLQDGCTTIWITHDVVEAMQFADKIILFQYNEDRLPVFNEFDLKGYSKITNPAALPEDCLILLNNLLGRYTNRMNLE